MLLNPLYHWSPATRYDAIRREGLRPGSKTTVCRDDTNITYSLQYICLGTDPQRAWNLSGAMEWVSEIEYWDLWRVELANTDELHVRGDFGPQIWEVKCRTPIPPDRMWWIGRRYDLGVPGKEMEPST